MGKGEVVLREQETTIVGTADHLAMVLRTSADRSRLVTEPKTIRPRRLESGQYAVTVKMLLPVATPTRRERLTLWGRTHPVMAAVGKALTFVALAFAVVSLVLLGLVALVGHLLAGVDMSAALGGLAVLVVLILLAGNRVNHSGACPGVAVHCKGCKR